MSALDIPLAITRFPNQSALKCVRLRMSLREFGALVPTITAANKKQLPFFKLAKFGDKRTPKNCLRHDDNVLEVHGVELDYDREEVSLEDAAYAFREAKIPGLLISTASHTPEAPHWRFWSPLSRPIPPEMRATLVSRIAGALPESIVFSGETWTLSQSFYAGVAADAPHPLQVVLIDD